MNNYPYQIIICRDGVPHETWESNTPNGLRILRVQQQALGEHRDGDIYEAVPVPSPLTEEELLLFAFSDAAESCPALRERFTEYLASRTPDDDDDPLTCVLPWQAGHTCAAEPEHAQPQSP